jgi:hypothetical protein
VTLCLDVAPQERAPNKKSSSPYTYSSVPHEPTPRSFMLIHPASKQHGCSSIRPLLQCTLVRLLPRFLSPSPAASRALAPCTAHPHGCSFVRHLPQRVLVEMSCHSPHRQPRGAPSLPAPLTYVARSHTVRPSPIAVGHAVDPAMRAGAHVPWHLRSSPAEPRAPMSVAGASGARAPRLAARSHPDGGTRLAGPSLPYVAYVCFKCFRHFRCMLQIFHLDVVKVDRGMLHMLQVFQRHVARVRSKCFICFHLFIAIFFYLDVAYVSHICCNSMFQMFQLFQSYVAASGFMLQIANLDVSCVSHMLQVHVSNVHLLSDVCCI